MTKKTKSLEVTSLVTQKTKTGYDQIQNETVISNGGSTKGSTNVQDGRTDRNLTSESTTNGLKDTKSEQNSNSERNVNSQTSTSRASVERANIAFTLSFSIPFTSPYPTESGSNC